MKKKIIAGVMIVLLALAGCGQPGTSADSNTNGTTEEQKTADVVESVETEGSKNGDTTAYDTLVVYFSRTGEQYNVGVIDKGNTAIVADMIASQTGADVFEILPQEDYYPYTYDELTDVAKKEQNEKRVMYECVRWGERGARLNDIAPGIIVTPLAIDEFNGPRGDFYKNMFAKCPAGRPGTADEMANIAELLMSDAGAFITGSTFLADGGATASYYYGPLSPQ